MRHILILLLVLAFPLFGAFPNICERCWYEVPNSNLDTVAQTPPPPGWSYFWESIQYNGGAYDTRRNRLIVAVGGHTAYAGNELYAFDVDSLKWFRIKDGATVYDKDDTLYAYYKNGGAVPDSQQPRPGYTFDQIEYDSTSDNLHIFGVPFAYKNGTTWKNIHRLNLSTLTWSYGGDISPDIYGGSLSARDPATGKIWFFGNGTTSWMASYAPGTGTLMDHGDAWSGDGVAAYQTGAIMPPKNRFISIGGGEANYWNLVTSGNTDQQTLTTTGCDSLMAVDGPGFEWSKVDNKMVGWAGGTSVYTMDTTYTCSEVTASVTNIVTPDGPTPYGTFGRWRYIPKYNVFMVVNATNGSVYFYRHSAYNPSAATDTVVITSPAENFLTNQGTIPVAWKVNGVSQSLGTTEVLGLEGANLIERCHMGVCDSVVVIRDQTAPVVAITLPGQDTTVGSEPFLIQFTVDAQSRSRSIPLNPGPNVVIIDTLDAAGNRGADTVTLTYVVPVGTPIWPSWSSLSVSDVWPSSMRISWTPAVDDSGVSRYRIYREGVLIDSVPGNLTYYTDVGLYMDHPYRYKVEAGDLRGNWSINGPDSIFSTSNELPPNPEAVAPPLVGTISPTILGSASFLFGNSIPIQTGMEPAIIDTVRAAVLRGIVKGASGNPLAGASVSILGGRPYGSTVTRSNGEYDLMVNGGGSVTVRIVKPGFLPVHRKLDIPWGRFVIYPEVVLVALDSASQEISMDSGEPMQVFRAGMVTDGDGSRRATLLFPTNTTAQKIYPDGSAESLDTLTFRATEYTMGANGPNAMPADLPHTSGYTYAVEYSSDQALEEGVNVVFNQPVFSYLENFVGLPVGWAVPSAYYDRIKGQWIPSQDGRVVRIHSIGGGRANLDVSGTGTPADSATLAELGVTEPEREMLASLYSVGDSLWRVPIHHMTPWDYNLGMTRSGPPPKSKPKKGDAVGKENEDCGSVIGCQTRNLGEGMPITGTPYSLHYRSDRVEGRKEAYVVEIPLSDSVLPNGMEDIQLEIGIAGRFWTYHFAPAESLSFTFEWDGLDAYGRKVQGQHPLTYMVGYGYDESYLQPPDMAASFGYSQPVTGASPVAARVRAYAKTAYTVYLGTWKNLNQKMGGWTMDVHHAYDVSGKTLFLGNGRRRSAKDFRARDVTERYAGAIEYGFSGDSGPAIDAEMESPMDLEFAMDGAMYFADWGNSRVRKIDANGTISTVAGNGSSIPSGDGGPALSAGMDPTSIALGPDGSLYIAEIENHRVRKVDSQGKISTIAGIGSVGFSGDGGPATLAEIEWPSDVHMGPDGSLYIAEAYRVRKIGTDGIIQTIAGSGSADFDQDSVPALEAAIVPAALEVDRSGNLFIADQYNARLFKVSPDGMLSVFAGTGSFDATGDGGLAIGAGIQPVDVSVAIEGDNEVVYVADYTFQRSSIRKIDPQGIISTVAGGADEEIGIKDNSPATGQSLDVYSIAPDWSGHLYFSGLEDGAIRKIRNYFPEFRNETFMIASESGDRVFSFDAYGRHLKTRHGLTGAALHTFEYDSTGLLVKIVDGDANEVAIERGSQGGVERIVSQFGQATDIELDANGYLVKAVNPADEEKGFTYTASGLMTEYTTPNGKMYEFTYDSLGMLIRDDNPSGGYKELTHYETADGHLVNLTTAMGRVKSYLEENLRSGEGRQVTIDPAGLGSETIYGTDGQIATMKPDSSFLIARLAPDPRFGMQSPYPESSSVELPSGKHAVVLRKTEIQLSNPADPFSIQTLSDTINIDGRVSTRTYFGATRLRVTSTPEGRRDSIFIDSLGRILERRMPGLERLLYAYDSFGRLETITRGQGEAARQTLFSYNSAGYLSEVEDAEGRIFEYAYDPAGRVIRETLPDGREVEFAYDADGNLAALTPPGRPTHFFAYNSLGLDSLYAPPALGVGAWNTRTDYNLDRQRLAANRPEGRTIFYSYDAAGRIDSLTSPTGSFVLHYHAGTGRLDSIVSPYGVTTSYAYDASLVTGVSWAGEINGSVSLEYDNYFRPVFMRVNGVDSIGMQYDLDGQFSQVGNMEIRRYPLGGRLQSTIIGTIEDTLEYTAFGEVGAYLATLEADTLYHAEYERDKLGRIIQKAEKVQGVTKIHEYVYDPAGRLLEVVLDGVDTVRYTYDSSGNRLAKEHPLGVDSGHYDDQDRLLEYGGRSFTYNQNGDLEAQINGSDTTTFEYDVFGNLVEVELADGTDIEYVVDGHNRRVGRKVNGILRQGFLYSDQLEPVAELDSAGEVVARFVYATKSHVPDYMIKGGVTYRIISDHLGSPRLVVNTANGAVAQRIDYDEFGVITYNSNPGFQPFGFAGGVVDLSLSLVRFGARDYHPGIGRWTKKDPIGFAGKSLNLYTYVGNDPINRIDPNGLEPVSLADLTGGVIDITGTVTDFLTNMYDMVDVNTVGADKYFHCMANCEGASRGPVGESTAEIISDFREWTDENSPFEPDSPEACAADQEANRVGRMGGAVGRSCWDVCSDFRPDALGREY